MARWLRILGEDCLYADPEWSDEDVLAAAQPENRVLVTRDAKLVGTARNRGLRPVQVPQAGPDEVLLVVYRALSLAPDPRLAATRCSLCNGDLERTDAAGARRNAAAGHKEPPREGVVDRHKRFWSCLSCGHPYWQGTHWGGIQAMRERLLARLA